MLRKIFTEVKNKYGITGKALSQATGISQKHISEYINGKRDVTSSTLWRMIEAMDNLAPGAKQYFSVLMCGCESNFSSKPQYVAESKDWRSLISNASPAEMEQILLAMADRWSQIKTEKESLVLSA